MNKVHLKDIINFINEDVIKISGKIKDLPVKYLRPPNHADQYTLDWISLSQDNKQKLAESSNAKVVIVDETVQYSNLISKSEKILVHVSNPKLIIAKIVCKFFTSQLEPEIHRSAVIDSDVIIGDNVFIGPNVVIQNSKIGNNVEIHGNSFIYEGTVIEDNVEIHAGAIIGNEAHNFIKEEKKQSLIKFPHLGKVIIKKNVIIGANSTISRGVLSDTIISESSKIAQLVVVGANNYIGKNCQIRSNAMLSGSITIGDNSIIAPSVTIREKCSIGNQCMIGMGAVVTKDVPNGETWFGNPAKKAMR